ncbi:MAG: hypothetical protein IE909_12355 [Campylobacterales bacterium]|nr:hypothetical protein [Campylobacterales bacterium]
MEKLGLITVKIYILDYIKATKMEIGNLNIKRIDQELLISECISNKIIVSNKQKKDLLKLFAESFLKSNYKVASNCLTLCFYLDTTALFELIKRKGLFRFSNYISTKNIILPIIDNIHYLQEKFQIDVEEYNLYLKTIKNLSPFDKIFKDINRNVFQEIKRFNNVYKRYSLLKTLLAFNDYLFLTDFTPDEDSKGSDKLISKSKEHISECISYLIYKINDIQNLKISSSILIHEKYYHEKQFEMLLHNASNYIHLREFEILIDHFGYIADSDKGQLKIYHKNPEFNKNLSLGYIRNEIQTATDITINNDRIKEVPSIIDYFRDIDLNDFVEKVSGEYERYIFKVNEEVLRFLCENYIKKEVLHKEEIDYLSRINKEQLLSYEKISSFVIYDDLTLMDFFVFNRFFRILFFPLAKTLIDIDEKLETKTLILRSLIPVIEERKLYSMFNFIFDDKQIDSYLDLICWNKNSSTILDLQYQPIIKIENCYLISLSVLTTSNVIRNLYALEYKKNNKNFFSDGKIDPVISEMAVTLDKIGIKYLSNVDIGSTEIDLLFIFQQTVFFCECKHTLHPTNPFDLRTTYNYIKKGEIQLSKVEKYFRDVNLPDFLKSKTHIENEILNAEYLIITSNRMFNGNIFKYPVRNLSEIKNFLINGTIVTPNGKYRVWKNKNLDTSDLNMYLSKKNIFHELFYKILRNRSINITVDDITIEFEKYFINLKELEDNIKADIESLYKIPENIRDK